MMLVNVTNTTKISDMGAVEAFCTVYDQLEEAYIKRDEEAGREALGAYRGLLWLLLGDEYQRGHHVVEVDEDATEIIIYTIDKDLGDQIYISYQNASNVLQIASFESIYNLDGIA